MGIMCTLTYLKEMVFFDYKIDKSAKNIRKLRIKIKTRNSIR